MRITLVTETYVPEINGVAKTLERLVNELANRGHAMHIVRPKQKHDIASGHIPETRVSGLPIPGYSGLQFGLPAGALLKALWQETTPDIVYVATEGPLGASAIRAANKLDIPVVSGFHTNFHTYSKHYHLGWLEKLIFSHLKKLHNRTRCTLAPSPDLVKELKRRGIHETDLFTRGVDTTIYNPGHRSSALRNHYGIDAQAPLALYVGRIAAEKNIHLVIDAYHAMREHNPQVRLMMVGDGPIRDKLKRQHADIVFTGPKLGVELSQHYASADIFLFASETETFGNVILEAMSSALAVIAYDYAAPRMHIQHQHNGMTVEFGNPKAFCDTAVNLINQPETLETIRTQARVTAEQTDWKHVIDHFEKVLVRYVKSESHRQRESEEPVSADGPA